MASQGTECCRLQIHTSATRLTGQSFHVALSTKLHTKAWKPLLSYSGINAIYFYCPVCICYVPCNIGDPHKGQRELRLGSYSLCKGFTVMQ